MKNTMYYECAGIGGDSIIRTTLAHARNEYRPDHLQVEWPNFDQKFGKLAKIFLTEHSTPLCQNALHDMQYDHIGGRPAKYVMMEFGEKLFHHFLDGYSPLEIEIHDHEMNAMLLFGHSVYKQGLESSDKEIKEKVLMATCYMAVDGKLCVNVLREQMMGSMAEELTARTGGVHPNFRPNIQGYDA